VLAIIAIWVAADHHFWGNTLQIIGSVVAAAGLFGAYVRSHHTKSLPEYAVWRLQQFWRCVKDRWLRLWRRPRNVAVTAGPAVIIATGGGAGVLTADAKVGLDPDASVEVRLSLLESAVNQLADRMPRVENRVDTLARDVERVAADASTRHHETLQHIERRIDDLDRRLNMKQVVDLRWAIIGILIATVGIALSY
jgi:hypothetical protein